MRSTTALTLLTVLIAQPSHAHGQTAPDASCTLPAGPLPERTRTVILLDTSASMRGQGDGKADIFQGVKNSIGRYVQQAQPDQLILVTFDNGVRSHQTFQNPASDARWATHLRDLKAEGRNTHLYRSIQAALQPLRAADGFITTVYVLTDGIDNESPRTHTAEGALRAFTGRGPLDRLHYVALGTDIPPRARQALQGSDYADGLTLPVGRLPDLGAAGLLNAVQVVTDPDRVPLPVPDGTPVQLTAGPGATRVTLKQAAAQDGHVALNLNGATYGAPALLCTSAPPSTPGSVAGKPARVLLRLNVTQPGQDGDLIWLNPGADLHLNGGEQVTLRYRARPGFTLTELDVTGLPSGLQATVQRPPGSQEFSVQLQNVGLNAGASAAPVLTLAPGTRWPLPTITGGPRASAPARPTTLPQTNAAPTPPATDTDRRLPGWLPWLTGALLLLIGAALAGPRLRRNLTTRKTGTTAPPPSPSRPPTVEGLEYTEDRALSLITAHGESMTLHAPLNGPFDIGQVARVPHLSGLRAQQVTGGLHLLHVPTDLDVSQGTRLLRAGDIVRPGALLGLAVARPARAPHASLGELAGLGTPLTLHAEGLTVHLRGPYGEHTLTLAPGVTDLGAALRSPALNGLKLGASGARVLVVELPHSVTLQREDHPEPIRPGTHLPTTPTRVTLGET